MAVVMPEPTPTEEVLGFLISAPTPEAVVALRPSPAPQERLRYLLDGSRRMTYIPEALRRLVAERAGGHCEYCRLHEDDTFFTHEVDRPHLCREA